MTTEVMPNKTEFKFNCPSCGQHMLISTEWCGMRIDCPSCKSRIAVPSRPIETRNSELVLPPSPRTHPLASPGTVQALLSTSASNTAHVADVRTPVLVKEGIKDSHSTNAESHATQGSPIPPEPEHLHIAVLTPAVKLEIVRAVRKRIGIESSWLPGKINGATAYAAKGSHGETIVVDVKDPEATRFSLIGAFLLEFHQRAVVQTASGRTGFLDHEIPDAIREVLLDEMSDEQRERIEDPLVNTDMMAISHQQCLATLDELEDRYSHTMDQLRAEKAKRRLGNVRLPDLVKKLEKKARIAPEDVATALYHELMEVRGRLSKLESRIIETKESPGRN